MILINHHIDTSNKVLNLANKLKSSHDNLKQLVESFSDNISENEITLHVDKMQQCIIDNIMLHPESELMMCLLDIELNAYDKYFKELANYGYTDIKNEVNKYILMIRGNINNDSFLLGSSHKFYALDAILGLKYLMGWDYNIKQYNNNNVKLVVESLLSINEEKEED